MKSFRSTGILLVLAALLGGWIWFHERGPVAAGSAEVLWRLDAASVQSLQLKSAGKAIELRKRGDNWQVSAGQSAPVDADAATVQNLLEQIQLLQADAVTTVESSKLKEYGLDTPQSTLIVNGTQKLELGDLPSFDATKVYARSEERITLLPASLHELIARPLEAWRDKAILRFDPGAVAGFAIKAPAVNASFARDKNGSGNEALSWQITQPLATHADAGTVQSFLGALSGAQTSRFLDDTPSSPSQWGLEKPLATVQLSDTNGELRIGKRMAGGYAAQRSGSAAVFFLADATFGLINRPLRDWRSKTPLLIDLNALSQAEIRARGAAKAFVKENDHWQLQGMLGQSTLESTHQAVTDVLFAAQNLVATDFIDQPASLSSYGLDAPEIEITLDGGQKRLALGRRNGKTYARAAEAIRFGLTVYVLNEDTLQEFQTGLNILLPARKPTLRK
ncbi:MAG: hypothetical protein JWN98_142 [Abditibacteriota bacterium]|nr:hypothetical protein [Abditibacteriota bacterium]